MRFTLLSFLPLLALIQPCISMTREGAHDRVYAFSVYNMDCEAWGGAGLGYVATACVGTGEGKCCNFNEFINFIEFGTPAGNSYYELFNGFYFTYGSITQIVDALMTLFDTSEDALDTTRVVPGRESIVGLYTDMGLIMDKAAAHAKTVAFDLSRHLANAEMALGAVSQYRAAVLGPKIISHMGTNIKDALWAIVEKENSLGMKYNELDWEEVVRKNPDLRDPNSSLYKKLREQLANYYKVPEQAADLSIRDKAGDAARLCWRYA